MSAPSSSVQLNNPTAASALQAYGSRTVNRLVPAEHSWSAAEAAAASATAVHAAAGRQPLRPGRLAHDAPRARDGAHHGAGHRVGHGVAAAGQGRRRLGRERHDPPGGRRAAARPASDGRGSHGRRKGRRGGSQPSLKGPRGAPIRSRGGRARR